MHQTADIRTLAGALKNKKIPAIIQKLKTKNSKC